LDFEKLVKLRRSSKWLFNNKKINSEDLKRILEAARYAPTPYNSQPFEINVVNDKNIIKQISKFCFKLDKKTVDGHFYWTRFSMEELKSKRTDVQIDVLPKFILDLKNNPELIDNENFRKKARNFIH